MQVFKDKKTIIAVAAVLVLLVAAGVALAMNLGQEKIDIAEQLSLGEKYLLEMDYEKAILAFNKVIKVDPMNPRGYTGAAEAYVGLGETEKAIDILKKGLLLMDNRELSDLLSEIESNNIQENNRDQSKKNIEFKQFGYENLSYDFKWGDDAYFLVQYNEGAIGGCILQFTLTGEISEVCEVHIASWSQEMWTNEAIQERADFVIPIWKDEEVINNLDFDGEVNDGFPIDPDDLGKSEMVLLFALDKECDALGYIIIPVQIPSSI